MNYKALKTTALAVSALALLAAAGSAQATTYLFTLDGCTFGCGASSTTPVGEVVTTLISAGEVGVTVTLFNGATFHDQGSPEVPQHALAFDLAGMPTITISGGPGSPFTAVSPQTAGTVSASGIGTFEYAINFPHEVNPPEITSFSFDITGAGVGLSSFTSLVNGAYFASDIWQGPNNTGNTGNVGATLGSSSAPEPAAWALMLAGFGGVGAALRSRRRTAAQAA